MIKFLFKGVIRDKSRSLFPILIVMAGVALTVLAYSWVNGAIDIFAETNAKFNTGHVKIMSRAYAREADQIPNDLALSGIKNLQKELGKEFPDFIWTPRTKFGGLLDIADDQGETQAQGPVLGIAVDLLSPSSPEWNILNIKKAVVRGRLPEKAGEILISDEFAQKLGVQPGETATLISSTMYGSMATANYTVAGTIHFGITAMDRGAMLIDITDLQYVMDMEDTAGEILGLFKDNLYHEGKAQAITEAFNDTYTKKDDEFSPTMVTLLDQSGLREYFNLLSSYSSIALGIFVLAMSVVLWNAGLMGNLRRYGEIGVRLAIGEDKGHIYRSMIAESLMIGFIGSVFGTLLGLAVSYYLQIKGIDISFAMKDVSLMMSDVMRAKVTSMSYVIGFIPGFLATLLGSSMSGIGIYKRQTSLLMKELEA
jgi:putative ABC transport system permease protein